MANGEVVLQGFDMAVPDVGDQLHFRQPLLSFGGNSTLYVARRVDWHGDGQALAVVDECEAIGMATLLTDGIVRHVSSGEGVAVAGAGFFQAASRVGLQMDGFNRFSAADCECWISVATPADFVALKRDLVDESRTVFDEELGKASRQRSRLTERGNAAMLVLRRCGPLHREDLAIRQLAAARQNRDLDLYRRLLARFEIELGEPEDRLHKKAARHIELADTPKITYSRWLEYNVSAEHKPKHSILKGIAYVSAFDKSSEVLQGGPRKKSRIAVMLGSWDGNYVASQMEVSGLFSRNLLGWRHVFAVSGQRKNQKMGLFLWPREKMNTLSAGSMSGTKRVWEETCSRV